MSAFRPVVRRPLPGAAGTNIGLERPTYGRELAQAYDTVMAEAAWPSLSTGLAQALGGAPAASAADVGCGSGRVLQWLAARGWRPLYGVDRSSAMLYLCGRRVDPRRVRLMQQDVRALALPRPVELVTCTFATLNYFVDDASLARALAAIARNLTPGGLFVADYIPWLDDRSPPSTHHQLVSAGGRRSTWRIRLDPQQGLSETRMVFRDPGGDVVERHVQRHRRPAEMKAALTAAGLTPLRSFALGPGGPSPWRMLVARRGPGRLQDLRHG
jgi:SAM-dependent methyltransferase